MPFLPVDGPFERPLIDWVCGRFPQSKLELILQILGEGQEQLEFDLSFNVAPGTVIPVLAAGDGKWKLLPGKWGFVPSWSKEARPKTRPINAKSETAATNGLFRNAFKTGRCVTETDGFFEWKALPDSPVKQAFWVRRRDRRTTLMAAIQNTWTPPGSGAPERNCALLTTTPNELVARIHDRMPVFIEPDEIEEWMDRARKPDDLKHFFASRSAEEWEAVPIGSAVGSPRNQGAEILAPVGEPIRV